MLQLGSVDSCRCWDAGPVFAYLLEELRPGDDPIVKGGRVLGKLIMPELSSDIMQAMP